MTTMGSKPATRPARRTTGDPATADPRLLSAVLDASPGAVLLIDASGAILDLNDRAVELLGHRAKPATPGPLLKIVPLTSGPLPEPDWQQLAPGASLGVQVRFTRQDGHPVRAYAHIARLRIAGPPQWLCHLQEDRAHDGDEEPSDARDLRLAAFFDHSPAACFQKDLNGRYLFINASCARLFNLDIDGCVGKTDFDLFPAEAAEGFRASDAQAIAAGRLSISEQTVLSADGPLCLLSHKFPLRDASGRIVSVAGIATDITELKRAEAMLRAGESRLRSIIQEMPVLMDAFDEDGNIVTWNTECERVTGYAASEIIGNPHALEMLYPDPVYRRQVIDEARRLRDTEHSSVCDLRTKSGETRSIEWFNVGARLKVAGWKDWGIGIDITERRRLEATLHEAVVREQHRLGRDLHDDLGQQLTGLALLASALTRGAGAGDEMLAANLRKIAAIASQAVKTCRNVALGLAPIDDLHHGLGDALRRLTSDFVGPDGDWTAEFTEHAPAPMRISLEARSHLYRIAQEAMTNAARHSGGKLVRVNLLVDSDIVRLTVSDDGKGIVRRPGRAAGMGLRTMRHRATAIGGRLAIAAGDPRGTVISCECPNAPT